jgi:hypothetical protein
MEYFPMAKHRAEDAVKAEEAKEAKELEAKEAKEAQDAKEAKPEASAVSAGSASMPAPAPATAAAGPAPGPAASPAPGPGMWDPKEGTPGKNGGKPWGPIPKDEKYYYKDGGKDASRLHMKEDMKLPTQGYWGKLVEHEDMKTETDDWGKEFGSELKYESYEHYCKKNPNNPWCIKQAQMHHSYSFSTVLSAPLLLALLVNVAL